MISIWIGIAVSVFVVDVMVKQLIEENHPADKETEFVGGKIVLRKVHNKGAFLGAMSENAEKLKECSLILGAGILVYDAILLLCKKRFLRKLGMMLLTGGGASNVFDRVVRGYVIDYIGFKTPSELFSKVTYNIGDFAIFIGTAFVVVVDICNKIRRLFTKRSKGDV